MKSQSENTSTISSPKQHFTFDMAEHRRSSSTATGNGNGRLRHGLLYRRESNMSDASFMADVDMAQDDIFSGPVSESVPTSNTGFAHRRPRGDSVTSFTYYEEDEDHDSDSWLEEEAILDDDGGEEGDRDRDRDEEAQGEEEDVDSNGYAVSDRDLESGSRRPSGARRKSSGLSKRSRSSRGSGHSAEQPLLKRHDSEGSVTSNISSRGGRNRQSQKIYIQSEDLTIVAAGFNTSIIGMAVYTTLCVVTGGLGYLLFRWLPRWQVKLIGNPTPLKDCSWVVVEVSSFSLTAPHTFKLNVLEPMGRNDCSRHCRAPLWAITLYRLWCS